MTAMSNLVQSVDWSKRGAEEWLFQRGLWVRDNHLKDPQTLETARSGCKNQVFVQYSITDDEARAVGRLLCDLKMAMPPEGAVVIMVFEGGLSFPVIAARSLWAQNRVERAFKDGVTYLKKRMGLE